MKKLAYILLFVPFFFTGCKQDHLLNPDLSFKKLSKNGGIWHLENLREVKFLLDGTVKEIPVTLPNDVYWVFYVRSENVGYGSILETNYLTIYEGSGKDFKVLGMYPIKEALFERITTVIDETNNEYNEYNVEEFTNKVLKVNRIIKNSPNLTQRKFELKKCNDCEIPYSFYQTNNGG